MPIYEYQCDACGHQLEKLQKSNDVPLVECPSCLQLALRKHLSVTGFQFKGTGWYATDGKSKGFKTDRVVSSDNCPAASVCGTQCNGITSAK